jgi:hypothetical protein
MSENDVSQTVKIDIFLEKFVKLWAMRYNPLRDFEMLKADLKKTLIFCLQCGIFKIKVSDFDLEYIKKIDQCETLCELSHACIYIYSLPHGFSEVLNRLLSEF